MNGTCYLGQIGNNERLTRQLEKGLRNYFMSKLYREPPECYDDVLEKDMYIKINGTCIFAFQRFTNEKTGDLENTFDVQIRVFGNHVGLEFFHKVLFRKEYTANFYSNNRVNDDLLREFVEECVGNIDCALCDFGDTSSVRLCCGCRELVPSDKLLCADCLGQKTEYEEVCPICLDSEKKEDVWVSLLDCPHIFHALCITKCYEQAAEKTCPYCRKAFSLHDLVII